MFGPTCSLTCNCQVATEVCNKTDGDCISGCKHGFEGYGCQKDHPFRIIDTANSTEYISGRLEIYHDRQWGTICDDEFEHNDNAAYVVCRQMHYGEGRVDHDGNDAGSGPIWLDEVVCNGTETRLTECAHSNWGDSDCDHYEDISITCDVDECADPKTVCGPGKKCKNTFKSWMCECMDGWYGLNCDNECADGMFGYTCSFKCNCADSNEVCNKTNGYCSSGCQSGSLEAGCQDHSFRVINTAQTPHNISGRLEVYHDGVWGTVCNDEFNKNEKAANIVCKQMYYAGGIPTDIKDGGSGPIWLDNVMCNGTESRIEDCSHGGWGNNNCEHFEDVVIVCDVDECENTEVWCVNGVTCRNTFNSWECDCKDGWIGARCNIECPDGQFGPTCNYTCNCENQTEVCGKSDGYCVSGCRIGYRETCLEVCLKGTYGFNCSESCSTCNQTVCDHVTGRCLDGCGHGYTGAFCNESTQSDLSSTSTALSGTQTDPSSTPTPQTGTPTVPSSTQTPQQGTPTEPSSTLTQPSSTPTPQQGTSTEPSSTPTPQQGTQTDLSSSTTTQQGSTSDLSSSSTSQSGTDLSSSTAAHPETNEHRDRPVAAIAIGSVAGVLFIAVVIAVIVFLYKTKKICNGKVAQGVYLYPTETNYDMPSYRELTNRSSYSDGISTG